MSATPDDPGRDRLPGVVEARARLLAAIRPLASETVPLDAAACGRVLAQPLVAGQRLPPFANSGMDGYAVRVADLAALPARLPVIGEMAAGMAPDAVTVRPGSCAKVMTGAPLPAGADAVVPYEWTDRGADVVTIGQRPGIGNAVRLAGEDLEPGDRILEAGHRLRPTDLAACAASGVASLVVARRPRVAVLTTGDELRPPGSLLGPGQIYDTAGVAVEALVAEAGGTVTARRTLPDAPEAVEAALVGLAAQADLLLTVGGVSVGDHDHVRDAIRRLGRLDLWRVAMRPGRPVAVGSIPPALVIGLPGNPVSACVTFILFAAPALLRLQGASKTEPPAVPAVLLETVEKPQGLETYHRCVVEPGASGLPGARLTGAQGSGITRSLALADGLLVLPREGAEVRAGTQVQVILLGPAVAG